MTGRGSHEWLGGETVRDSLTGEAPVWLHASVNSTLETGSRAVARFSVPARDARVKVARCSGAISSAG